MKKDRKAQGGFLKCHRLMTVFLVLFCLFLMVSCKNKTPDDIISPGKMEEILFDYHMAEATEATMPGDKGENKGRFVDAVFQKYGISEADFTRSMAYYFRHTDKLSEIYSRLRERYGSLVAGVDHSIPDLGVTGDTVNIWNGPSAYLLSNQSGNHILYEVKADSSFHAGDRIAWSFNTRWVYHDGSKNMIAIIKAEYANDSVATATRDFFSSGKQEISLTLADVPLRRIVCMLYLVSSWTEKPRLAIVESPALLRARIRKMPILEEEQNAPPAAPDSLFKRAQREREIRDSLLRDEREPRVKAKGIERDAPMRFY